MKLIFERYSTQLQILQAYHVKKTCINMHLHIYGHDCTCTIMSAKIVSNACFTNKSNSSYICSTSMKHSRFDIGVQHALQPWQVYEISITQGASLLVSSTAWAMVCRSCRLLHPSASHNLKTSVTAQMLLARRLLDSSGWGSHPSLVRLFLVNAISDYLHPPAARLMNGNLKHLLADRSDSSS